MASLENTISELMTTSKASENAGADSSVTDDEIDGRSPDADGVEFAGHRRLHDNINKNRTTINARSAKKPWKPFQEPTYSTPPYSTVEAQNMIQQELVQGAKLSKQKREAFHAALASLSDSLGTSHHDQSTLLFDSYNHHLTAEKLDLPKYPEIETVKWMLTRKCYRRRVGHC